MGGGAPVLVAASVARGELPPCLGHAAAHPHGAGRPRREDLGAEVADLRVHLLRVRARVRARVRVSVSVRGRAWARGRVRARARVRARVRVSVSVRVSVRGRAWARARARVEVGRVRTVVL